MTTKRVQFSAKSGAGAEGEIAEPASGGKAPGVVLIQEWWGVNDHIRSLLDRLAQAGFVAFAPDLFHGKVTKSAEEAQKLMQQLDWPRAMDEIAGAQSYLASHARCNGNVGIMGFCLGGALAFEASETVPGFKAIVPFYGLKSADAFDASKVHAPILAHFAKKDQHIKVEYGEKVLAKMKAAGKPMQLEVYDADHAFANDTRPEVYNPGEAKKAWDRSTAFLHQQLG